MFDEVAFVDRDFAEVAVDGLQTVAVVEHDAVAIDAERGGVDDAAVVGGLDADVLGDGEVVAEVDLLVDLFALVDIVTDVGEVGLDLGVVLLAEGSGPEKVGFGLEPQIG